ncbi:MAG: hypothetical protein ACXWCP_03420 [Burkholderiales bacterium]
MTGPHASATIERSREIKDNPMHGYHDLGGTPAGPIEKEQHELQLWEKRVEALLLLMKRRQIQSSDENRRALESLGAEVYHALTYSERRILALSNNLISKGVFSIEELAAKLQQIEQRKDQLP